MDRVHALRPDGLIHAALAVGVEHPGDLGRVLVASAQVCEHVRLLCVLMWGGGFGRSSHGWHPRAAAGRLHRQKRVVMLRVSHDAPKTAVRALAA
jgi:hypothetical protein